MHLRVRIEREPFANEGQPVRKIESAKARAGIVAAILGRATGRGHTDKALQKGADGDGRVSLATPYSRCARTRIQDFPWAGS